MLFSRDDFVLTNVVIVGRPNVGKSTLFNRLIGRRSSIVHKISGTTIDRNDREIFWGSSKFTIIDTAGLNFDSSFFLKNDIFLQINNAIKVSDIILFVVDGRTGVHNLDFKVADKVRISKKKTILVVNKIDTQKDEMNGYEFYKLGFNDVVFISANHGRCINDLLDKICSSIKQNKKEVKNESEILKIAIVGKSNVGKSSFVNALINQNRSIVNSIPGTTRDSVTVKTKINNKDFVLIDTAGVHRRNNLDDIEYLSYLSTNRAISYSDVVVLVIDALHGIGDIEIKIARLLIRKKKAIIIAVNKWDLIKDKKKTEKYFFDQFKKKMKFMFSTDIFFISTKTRQRIFNVIQKTSSVFEQFSKRLTNDELDRIMTDIIIKKPYLSGGKTLEFRKYLQIASRPPVFVFFVNDTSLVHFSYKRFIENCFRDKFKFSGTPIILKFTKYNKNKKEFVN